jgi:hypothetical protein
MMRAFTELVAWCCLGLAALGIILQFDPAGPSGLIARSVQGVAIVSAIVVGLLWLLVPWPNYPCAVAFVVWADCAVAVVAVTMSSPEARLSVMLYMGLAASSRGSSSGGRRPPRTACSVWP